LNEVVSYSFKSLSIKFDREYVPVLDQSKRILSKPALLSFVLKSAPNVPRDQIARLRWF
jgi:hypothetical protein